ncbi:MAG: DNA mismatch repair endonuclease MutL [Gemmatimonadetes bacterium]|nr:DNA mismatch repair endonuclease MutL [Gemmatimonadota bacterium]
MARRIRILPEILANQIAAGEVVERPASVVKELVENALDAGATRVEIALRNGGKTEIRVSDDGWGMGREDAMLSLDRHATSKLTSASDLDRIRTLGFRGEALPSIASVSRLALETAEREGEGTRVTVHGGKMNEVESCARRRGTTVTVRSLFFNIPARAKFLKSAAAETRAAVEVVTTLALAHPGIAFRVESNDAEVIHLPAAPRLGDRVAALWGGAAATEMLPVAHRSGDVAVSGFVQRPAAATPGGRRAYLFVNGRAVGDRYLTRAADRAYQTTVAAGIRPSHLLYLEVPDGAVDVNVHPAKSEVRFRERAPVEAAVHDAVRAALATPESTPALGGHPAAWPERTALPAVTPSPAAQTSLFVTAEPGGELDREPAQPLATPGAMWQVHDSYIFAETRGGLIIVDQHSAHERVLYEQIMADFGGEGRPGQRLLFPLTLRLAPAEYSIAEQVSGVLRRVGFEVEPFGQRAVIVHAVPDPHPGFDPERCLREVLAELAHGSPLVDPVRTQHERVALSLACKGAIKAGQRLSQEEISELFDRLFATELPYHDIHGRPTVVQLSLSELHRRFGRHA